MTTTTYQARGCADLYVATSSPVAASIVYSLCDQLDRANASIYALTTPLWKDLPHTGEYMQALCDALNEPDRLENEYLAATLRIDNDLLVIAELTAERDAYAKCADDMAAAHKVERDALTAANGDLQAWFDVLKADHDNLKDAARLALDFVEFCWRDVTLNEFAEEKRATTEAALKVVI